MSIRKIIVVGLAAASLASVAGATIAAASPNPQVLQQQNQARQRALAIGAGLAIIGTAAAVAAHANRQADTGDCYLARRWVETPYGVERRTVRICE
jgi:hypothetical protein